MNSPATESTIFVLHKNDGSTSIHKKSDVFDVIDESASYVTEVTEYNHRLVAAYTINAKLSVTPVFSVTAIYDGELIQDKQFIDVTTFKECSQFLYVKRYVFGKDNAGIVQLDHSTKLYFGIGHNMVTLPMLSFDGSFLDDAIFNVLHSAQLSARNLKRPDNKDYGFYWSYDCNGLVFNCKYELCQQTNYELVKFTNQ